jgi:hypothetical protein
LGDLLLDVVITPARPIERGTDVPGTVTLRRGGSAANVAAAFVRQATTRRYRLGRDPQPIDSWPRSADGVRVHAGRRSGASGRLAALIGERAALLRDQRAPPTTCVRLSDRPGCVAPTCSTSRLFASRPIAAALTPPRCAQRARCASIPTTSPLEALRDSRRGPGWPIAPGSCSQQDEAAVVRQTADA